MANTVALTKAKMDGSKNEFSQKNIKHTIFLFNKEKAVQIIDEFGQFILDTFTDEELRKYEKEGIHVVGMIHDKKEETKDDHFPKGIYDYWNNYESKKANKRVVPEMLIDYVRKGNEEFTKSGERTDQIEWICKGLRRLINYAKGNNYISDAGNTINSITRLLPDEKKDGFRRLILMLADIDNPITKDDLKEIINISKKILSLFDAEPNEEVNSFWRWNEDENNKSNEDKTVLSNHYVYFNKDTKRKIDMEFGSIHSVKGRTHLATLVLRLFCAGII